MFCGTQLGNYVVEISEMPMVIGYVKCIARKMPRFAQFF